MRNPLGILSAQPLGSSAPTEIRILPAGAFRSTDGSGRPADVKEWRIDRSTAAKIISASFSAQKELLIDYEHQSLRSEKNGQPVPAAGWFSGLEWREGEDLFATGIQWNKQATDLIAAREYRFISPVFSYDTPTGDLSRIFSFAITNSPALSNLFDLSQVVAASAMFERAEPAVNGRAEDQRGNELLARMSQASSEFASRTALSTLDSAALCWSKSNASAVENQRGVELIARMSSFY